MNSSAAPWGSTWTANFPAGEVFSLQVTQRIMAGLGLLATVAMYVDYSRKPRQQTAANRLFLFASAADLLFHLMEIIGE
ncbi:hypothetical protein HK405_015664 [Cladochytrium tenue]|nr:hypothetical protein HK405_015664 [Cladochytrium tenue]